LTEEEIEDQLASLKSRKKSYREQRKECETKISGIRQEMKTIEAEKDRLLAEVKAICIQGRNDYSRGAIQRDFAMGIKE
jgi:hypothetical protein